MDADRSRRYPFVPGTPPLNIVGADGNFLHTADGRRIFDGAGGAIVNCIGWGRPEMAETAAELLRGSGYVLPTFATETRIKLIERLVDGWLPRGLTQCMFVGGGSESVDSAIRISRQHHVAKGNPEKWKVLGRAVSYHGATLGSLSVSNHDRRRAGMGQLLLDVPKIDNLDVEAAIKTIEAEDPATVSAVIAEPVVGAAGAAIVASAGYWSNLRQYCTDNDILLIADEVMTGVGRTGQKFGVDHWDLAPDLLVGAKGLAGGYAPIGGVFATEAVTAPLADSTVMYFTFSGNDLACGLADKTLQILEDEDLVDRARTQGEKLRRMLNDAFGDHPQVVDVRGLGLLQGLELAPDGPESSFDGALTPLIIEEALARDCWIYPAGSAGVPDGLLFGPAYTVTDEELASMVAITGEAIDAAVARLDRPGGSA